MFSIKLFIRILPWAISTILALLLAVFLYTADVFQLEETKTIVTQNTVLREVESLGKLELVRYNFKDITELERKNESLVYQIFKMGDAKIALISVGSATGCLDLTKIDKEQIRVDNDTLIVRLPEPELCNYKLDMDKTRIYSLYSEWKVDEKEFIQEGYRLAEQRIKESALESGIMEQTKSNAELILRPLLEKVAGMPVVFTYPISVEDNPIVK